MDIKDYKENALEFWDYYLDLNGIEPSFKTYLDNQAIATSIENVKENFEHYKMSWSSIGKDVSNADEVYELFFNNDNINHIPTSEEIIKENNEIIKNAQDPNVKLYEPNYMEDIYKNSSILSTSDDEDIFKVKCEGCNKIIYTDSKSAKPICKECKSKELKTNNRTFKLFLIIILGVIVYYFRGYSLAVIAGVGIVLGFLYDEFGRKK